MTYHLLPTPETPAMLEALQQALPDAQHRVAFWIGYRAVVAASGAWVAPTPVEGPHGATQRESGRNELADYELAMKLAATCRHDDDLPKILRSWAWTLIGDGNPFSAANMYRAATLLEAARSQQRAIYVEGPLNRSALERIKKFVLGGEA